MTRLNMLSTLLAGLVLGALITLAAYAAITSRRSEPAQALRLQGEQASLVPEEAAAPVLETIRQRRTVRAYTDEPVPREDLMAILDAAHYAATAGNQQPWTFLVVEDREKLDQLKALAVGWYLERVRSSPSAAQQDMESLRTRVAQALEGALSAPVYVAVLVDKEAPYSDYIVQDGTLAAANLMIAARALGYGTGFFTSFFPEQQMKRFFGIPDRYSLICFTPIGVPEDWPEMPAKKDLAELVVFDVFAEESEG